MTMVTMLDLSLREIGGSNVLAQAVRGREVLGKLLRATNVEPLKPQQVFLSFKSVDVATSSFLRESVLAYRTAMRARHSNFYPVICDANEAVEEELDDTLRKRGEAMLNYKPAQHSPIGSIQLIGELDPKHHHTFDLVMKLGETDAGTLLREAGKEEAVTRTAWNNRLAALASLGLVIEVNQGRAKRYKPILKGM